MRRKLFTFAALISAIVCIGGAASMLFIGADEMLAGQWQLGQTRYKIFVSNRGLEFRWERKLAPPVLFGGANATGQTNIGGGAGFIYTTQIPEVAWDHFADGRSEGLVVGFESWLFIRFWLITAVAALLPMLYLLMLVRRRNASPLPNHCVHCGYDLRATPDRCPECGQPAVSQN